MSFVSSSLNYKNYMLQNLLILKMLSDRGVPITRYYDVGFLDLLEYMFGSGVTVEKADILVPDFFDDPEDDEESYLYYFKERPQSIFKVPLPITCSPDEAEELLPVLKKAVLEGEDVMCMPDCFLLEASVEEGKIVVMRFVDYYPETSIDDEGINLLFLFETLIEFWDKVVQIAERRKKQNEHGVGKHQAA